MGIITISRRSFSLGSEIAESVAENLGYDCISREVLLSASEQFNIPEIKLTRAIADAPSLFDRMTYGKEKYIAFVKAALLKELKKDNVVYHGLAGQFLLQDMSHVLKVQIIADMEDRIKLYKEKTGDPEKEALKFLKKLDIQRHKWSKNLYGLDLWDSSLYDLVIHVKNIKKREAVDIICQTAKLKSYETTPGSLKEMEDEALASEVKIALIGLRPDAEVLVRDGLVKIKTRDEDQSQYDMIINEIEEVIDNIKGIKETIIQVMPL